MKEEDNNKIREILDSIPDEFRIIENQINPKAVEEFYQLSEQIVERDFENLEILTPNTDKEELVILAKIGNIKSYRRIEKIIEINQNSDLFEFAHVALKFARIKLENKLSDEPIGFISSGLGGIGNKLRYYFAIKSSDEIDKGREQIIKEKLRFICKNSDSELETIENFGNYVLIKILVSMDYAIGMVIDQLIDKCKFVDNEYFCSNVERPPNETIEKWINNEIE